MSIEVTTPQNDDNDDHDHSSPSLSAITSSSSSFIPPHSATMASTSLLITPTPTSIPITSSPSTSPTIPSLSSNHAVITSEAKLLPKKRKLTLGSLFGSEEAAAASDQTSVVTNDYNNNDSSARNSQLGDTRTTSSNTTLSTTTASTSDTNNNQILYNKSSSSSILTNGCTTTTSNNNNNTNSSLSASSSLSLPACDLSEWTGHRVLARRLASSLSKSLNESVAYLPGVIKCFDPANCSLGIEFDSSSTAAEEGSQKDDQMEYYSAGQLSYIITDSAPSFREIKLGGRVAAKVAGSRQFQEAIVEEIVDVTATGNSSSSSHNSKSTYRIRFIKGDEAGESDKDSQSAKVETVSRANLRLLRQPWADEEDEEPEPSLPTAISVVPNGATVDVTADNSALTGDTRRPPPLPPISATTPSSLNPNLLEVLRSPTHVGVIKEVRRSATVCTATDLSVGSQQQQQQQQQQPGSELMTSPGRHNVSVITMASSSSASSTASSSSAPSSALYHPQSHHYQSAVIQVIYLFR